MKKNLTSAELLCRLYYKDVVPHSICHPERKNVWLKFLANDGIKEFHSKPVSGIFTIFYLFWDDSLLGITYEDKKKGVKEILRVDAWSSTQYA